MVSTNLPYPLTKQQVTTALGYTPAGGENLVLDSVEKVSDNGFIVFNISEDIKPSTEYTISIWANAPEGKEFEIKLGESQSNYHLFVDARHAVKNINGVYYVSGISNTQEITDIFTDKKIGIRIVPHEDPLNFTIDKIKIERGTVTDPVWTPAPEDVVVRSELKNIFFGENGKYLGKTKISDINSWINELPPYTIITASNEKLIDPYGSMQTIIAWVNENYKYAFVLVMSFAGMWYGTRSNTDTLVFKKIQMS